MRELIQTEFDLGDTVYIRADIVTYLKPVKHTISCIIVMCTSPNNYDVFYLVDGCQLTAHAKMETELISVGEFNYQKSKQ